MSAPLLPVCTVRELPGAPQRISGGGTPIAPGGTFHSPGVGDNGSSAFFFRAAPGGRAVLFAGLTVVTLVPLLLHLRGLDRHEPR